MSKIIIVIASVLLALAVAAGAFGAHALKAQLSTEMLQTWKTAVDYHFYHALGLLLIGVLSVALPGLPLKWPAILLVLGMVLFSGSLYALSLTGIKVLGAITPLGGLSFIAAWLVLAFAVWKKLPF